MKQIIVMVSMVALGIVIAGFVMGFGESASQIAEASKSQLTYENLSTLPETE